MNRRTTTIIAVGALGALGASAALLLAVPTNGTAVALDAPITLEETGTRDSFYGTAITIPEGYAAFYVTDGALQSRGDITALDQETLDSILAQLNAAPANSVLFVDTDSLREDGMTTVLTTVTPTNGFTLGSSNEEIQQWLTSVFADTAGTVDSLSVENVPNASLSYEQTTGEITWQVTEYVFQFGDATVSARLSTVDDGGETRAEVDAMLASMTR